MNGRHWQGLKLGDECGNVEWMFLFFGFELTVVSVCFLELIREDREVSVGGSEEPPFYSCGSEDYGASSTRQHCTSRL